MNNQVHQHLEQNHHFSLSNLFMKQLYEIEMFQVEKRSVIMVADTKIFKYHRKLILRQNSLLKLFTTSFLLPTHFLRISYVNIQI